MWELFSPKAVRMWKGTAGCASCSGMNGKKRGMNRKPLIIMRHLPGGNGPSARGYRCRPRMHGDDGSKHEVQFADEGLQRFPRAEEVYLDLGHIQPRHVADLYVGEAFQVAQQHQRALEG